MPASFTVTRLSHAPIIHTGLDPSIGENIQGPSLVRVPGWVTNPLGKYYLYFADHKGAYIRLAYADALTGPWRIHVPGALQLQDSQFLTKPPTLTAEQLADFSARMDRAAISHDLLQEITTPHIASPDVHIDHHNQQFVMYFHGLEAPAVQLTRIATATDGIHFKAQPQVLGRSYFRVFRYAGYHYALAMPGQMYRSKDGFDNFEAGPRLFNPNMRHSAVRVVGDELQVFWTQVGDAPEAILYSTIDLHDDWHSWQNSAPVLVMAPVHPWEGAQAPKVPSVRSTAYGRVNQLRDPALYEEAGLLYLLYAVAGESGIGLAQLTPPAQESAPAAQAQAD